MMDLEKIPTTRIEKNLSYKKYILLFRNDIFYIKKHSEAMKIELRQLF